MKFIVRPQLAWTFIIFGIFHAVMIGSFLVWSQKLKFIDFGAYVVVGGESTWIVVAGLAFFIFDIIIACLGLWFMKHEG